MEVIDIIRQLCTEKNISVSQLENELGYGNGSLGKSKNMSAERIYQIAQYFGVPMEYLITGKTINETDEEMKIIIEQQNILKKINDINQEMFQYYKNINRCQDELTALKEKYNIIENKRKEYMASPNSRISKLESPSENDAIEKKLKITFSKDNTIHPSEDIITIPDSLFDDQGGLL